MTYRKNVLRPGMTAIVAVLALSSTPSLAQDAATAVDAPPAPVALPEPIEMPAPETAPAEVAPPAAEATAEPVAEPATRAAPAVAPVRRAAAPARRPAAGPAVTASAPAAAAEAPAAEPAPIAAPVEAAVPTPIPVQQAAAPPAEASAADDVLPIAGAGIGVLALVGGAVALNRRRRRADDVGYEPETVDGDHVAPAAPEPAPVMPLAARTAAPTAIPAGLDLSRYGRHTQAAYRGPTPDNPSLSLKRRLKRAAFFDGRERMASEGAAAPAPVPVSRAAADAVTTKVAEPARQAATPAFAPRRTGRAPSQGLFGFQQPAFQS